ncbi:MAG TPA: hypothetical protein VE090_02200 [Methylomirabilota bacterium]|nr:hypothetical protein [Methylomirabilota bacterium]
MRHELRRYIPDLSRRQPESIPHLTDENVRLFSSILDTITKEGKPQLKKHQRTKLANKHTTVYKPYAISADGTPQGLTTVPFTIKDGATLLWKSLPTAVVYGHAENYKDLYLVGGVHYPNTLKENSLDIRDPRRVTALIPEFPGLFLRDTDYLAFCIAPIAKTDALGIIVGDINSDNRTALSIAMPDLKDPRTKTEKFNEITTFIRAAVEKKFFG